MECKQGIIKTHSLNYEEYEAVEAIYSCKDSHEIKFHPKLLYEAITNVYKFNLVSVETQRRIYIM